MSTFVNGCTHFCVKWKHHIQIALIVRFLYTRNGKGFLNIEYINS